MLYLKNGLHSPLLAGAFALFCVLASFGIGNMSQCNSIAQGLSGSFGIPSGIVGAVTAVLLGAVLLGGLKRLSRVTETLVPFMALFYMGGAVVVLGASSESAAGVRADLLDGVRYKGRHRRRARLRHDAGRPGGVSRGVFSNEAGLGSSVMVHAAADAREPCEQGMWAVFEVFFDTIVMCSVTAFVILTSGVYDVPLRARVRHAFAFSADNRCTAYRRGVLHRIRTVRRGLRCGVARAVCILDPARLVVLRAACSGLFDGGAGNSGLQGGLSSGGGSGLHDAA